MWGQGGASISVAVLKGMLVCNYGGSPGENVHV